MLNLEKKNLSRLVEKLQKISRAMSHAPPPLPLFMLNGQSLSEINVPSFNSSANFAIKIVTFCFPS